MPCFAVSIIIKASFSENSSFLNSSSIQCPDPCAILLDSFCAFINSGFCCIIGCPVSGSCAGTGGYCEGDIRSGYTIGTNFWAAARFATPLICLLALGIDRIGAQIVEALDKSTILFSVLDIYRKWYPSSKKLLSYHLRSKGKRWFLTIDIISSTACPICRVVKVSVE